MSCRLRRLIFWRFELKLDLNRRKAAHLVRPVAGQVNPRLPIT
jgi:hypothetical protein